VIVRKAHHLLWPGVIAAAALFSGCKARTSVSSQVRASELPRPDAATLAMFNKYCSGCHAAYAGGGDQAWTAIRRDALEISARLDWDGADKDQVMPPADSDQHGLLASAPGDRARMRNAVKGASAGGLATELPLDRIRLQPGFRIGVWAKAPGARSMTMGDDGTVYVGTGGLGGRNKKVYAIKDADGDGTGENVTIVRDFEKTDPDDDLLVPNGVAFKDGALYVGMINRIFRFDNIGATYNRNPRPSVEAVRFPDVMHHGWKFIAFGPDGRLYVPVGAEGNMTDDPDNYALIYRLSEDMTSKEVFAKGVRNTVGFDWHPVTGEMWFTDNGRDNLVIDASGSDDIPPDELNRAPRAGLNFGHPFCHGGYIPDPDPEYAKLGKCSDAVPPVQKLGPHVAALGMRFYTGQSFPQEFRNQVFIAEHGSWNRSQRIGYRVTLVRLNGNQSISYEDFASGWLGSDGSRWGRPADVLVWRDGSLLVSDDLAGVIYRIAYQP
jgi:glucose/arabinose dehydrogenase